MLQSPFSMQEYSSRQDSVRASMRDRSLDALVIGDPANMNWLTGFDAWSFYVPQIMLLTHDRGPVWMGREMDTTLFVKNGPCFASLGLGGEGYISFSIATPTGEGVTTPLTFTRERRCSLIDDLRIV